MTFFTKRKYNPLAYPAGRTPRFSPFITNTKFSAIASTGSFINLLTGGCGVVNGASTSIMDPRIGPATGCPSTTNAIDFSGQPTTNDTSVTLIVISVISASTTGQTFFTTSSTNTGWRLNLNNGGQKLQLTAGGVASLGATSMPTMNTNSAYFMAGSANASASNLLIRNMSSGAITSLSFGGANPLAPSGTYEVCGVTAVANSQASGGAAAALFASSFSSMQTLTMLAYDPWSIWYS